MRSRRPAWVLGQNYPKPIVVHEDGAPSARWDAFETNQNAAEHDASRIRRVFPLATIDVRGNPRRRDRYL